MGELMAGQVDEQQIGGFDVFAEELLADLLDDGLEIGVVDGFAEVGKFGVIGEVIHVVEPDLGEVFFGGQAVF